MTSPTSAASRPGRLGVGLVGAGRVGAVLASALRAAGHSVVGVSAVSQASRDRVEAMLPGVPVLEIPEVVERAELVLLTVPDDVLPTLVDGLATTGAWQPGQIVVHTAGRFGTAVLEPAQRAGAIPVALHPAMTFTGTSVDLSRIVGCPFAVTAPAPVLPIGQALVVEIGGEPVPVPEAQRPIYHAALAHGANHLVTLVTQAAGVLRTAGIEEPGHYLAPLLAAALDGAVRDGTQNLTGPVVRGDLGTVREHLVELDALAARIPEHVDVAGAYRALARATTQRSLRDGRIGDSTAQALLDALAATPTSTSPGSSPAGAPAVEGSTAAAGATASDAATCSDSPRSTSDREPLLVRGRGELRQALADRPGRRAVVMTMGALHEGHLDLVREARRRGDVVVVTIFVNPLQFGAGEDLDAYPRDLEGDLARLAEVGADLVFAPEPETVYPGGEPRVRIDPGPIATVLEGASRPTHFAGVLTVVAKLLHLVGPDVAVFGQKDAQQLALVRSMVRDLDLGVEIVAVPTHREPDGLALSSRNAYLTSAEREQALALSAALRAGQAAAPGGTAAVLDAARAVLDAAAGLHQDYLELVDPETFDPVAEDADAALLVVAARVGSTRLLDNIPLTLAPKESS